MCVCVGGGGGGGGHGCGYGCLCVYVWCVCVCVYMLHACVCVCVCIHVCVSVFVCPGMEGGGGRTCSYGWFHLILQWSLVVARTLGPLGLPCCIGFLKTLCQGRETERCRGLGPARSPCCGRVLLCPTSLWRGSTVYMVNWFFFFYYILFNDIPSCQSTNDKVWY